jgi:serine protease Do
MARVYPALVRIIVVTAEPMGGRLAKFQAGGSGAIISPEGHVITNHHVAGKARQIVCSMPDGERIDATLIGTDALADISVLKLNLDSRPRTGAPLPVATFGDSDQLKVGDTVLAMGSPAAISQSVTRGIVSNTRMIIPEFFWPMTFTLDGEEVGTLVRWIGHDAQIFGGNSGGPLVNLEGQIVGINEIGIGSIGGAIPSNLARSVAQQLIQKGKVDRSWTGLECQPRLRESKLDRGILVSGVIKDSPADKAGLKAGDVVTSFDGTSVNCAIAEELPIYNRLVLSTPIGKSVSIEALRNGTPTSFTLTTVSRDGARGKDEELNAWGITARDFTQLSALEAKRPDRNGVLVQTLRAGGPAAEAKPALQAGDVIVQVADKPVKGIADLRRISQELTKGKDERVPAIVAFERKTARLLTVVRIGRESDQDNPAQARKAWLPVATQVLTRDLAEAMGVAPTKGVRVTQVFDVAGAAKPDLMVGDIILKLDGDPINATDPEDAQVFATMVRQRKIGVQATLDILRDKEARQIKVVLGAPPTPSSELKRHKDDDFEFTAREMSFDDRTTEQLAADLRGVVMEKVETAGWAALAHVAVGDILLSVDGRPTPDIASLTQALKAVRDSKARRVVFFVRRGIHTLYLELEPNWAMSRD